MKQTADVDSVALSRITLWTYGALAMPLALLSYPLAVWLPRAYSTDVGISLSLVGLIISAAALFDAITDPVIGVAEEQQRSQRPLGTDVSGGGRTDPPAGVDDPDRPALVPAVNRCSPSRRRLPLVASRHDDVTTL